MGTQGGDGHLHAQERGLGRDQPSDTWTSGSQPPGCEKMHLCGFSSSLLCLLQPTDTAYSPLDLPGAVMGPTRLESSYIRVACPSQLLAPGLQPWAWYPPHALLPPASQGDQNAGRCSDLWVSVTCSPRGAYPRHPSGKPGLPGGQDAGASRSRRVMTVLPGVWQSGTGWNVPQERTVAACCTDHHEGVASMPGFQSRCPHLGRPWSGACDHHGPCEEEWGVGALRLGEAVRAGRRWPGFDPGTTSAALTA